LIFDAGFALQYFLAIIYVNLEHFFNSLKNKIYMAGNNKVLVVALMTRIAEADGDLCEVEMSLIEDFRLKLGVMKGDLNPFKDMPASEILKRISWNNDTDILIKYRDEFMELVKADGKVDFGEIVIFNMIAKVAFPEH
jgi:hypothetical protein